MIQDKFLSEASKNCWCSICNDKISHIYGMIGGKEDVILKSKTVVEVSEGACIWITAQFIGLEALSFGCSFVLVYLCKLEQECHKLACLLISWDRSSDSAY